MACYNFDHPMLLPQDFQKIPKMYYSYADDGEISAYDKAVKARFGKILTPGNNNLWDMTYDSRFTVPN